MSSTSHLDASPELLRMIFSHLNSDTLRTTVAPVCREWYLASRHRIIRDVAWDDARKDKELSKVLVGIPGAGRLLWHAHGTNGDLATEQWTKLQSALGRDYNRRQRDRDQSMKRPMLDSPLFQLELSGSIDIENCIPRIRKYLGSLTCLRLLLTRDCTFEVKPLFRDCLSLEVVHLESTVFLDLPEEWVSPEEQEIDGTHSSTQLQLQMLVLRNARIQQTSFERFLTNTPRLRRLKCISMQCSRPRKCRHRDPDRVAYDHDRFYQYVFALPYRLESFHVSFEIGLPTGSEFFESFRVCPTSSEWTVHAFDLPLPVMLTLQDLSSYVTTLELACDSRSKCPDPSILYRYLCQAPHLLYLRAPNTIIPVTEFDIHGLLSRTSTEPAVTSASETGSSSSPSGAAIWACRRLSSLQVAFSWGPRELNSVLVQSRVIFGYISRVCPELKELAIFRPELSEDDVDEACSSWLDLKGGLCLLSRLQHLERLQIGSGLKEIGCKRVDLDWIVHSGYVGARRYARTAEVSSWHDELLQERLLMDTDESTAGGRRIREDVLELRYLGRLHDVATRLKELEAVDAEGAGGSRCLPFLSRLSIDCGNDFGRRPERELQRILD